MNFLRPNSPEWLEALAQQNPHQAAFTKAIVAAAGREDICSICGDLSSQVYTRVDAPAPVGSIRLCDDCRDIQAKQGAKTEPLN